MGLGSKTGGRRYRELVLPLLPREHDIQTFHRLIDWLNTHHSLDIPKLPLNTSPLDNDARFAGITEADGYFGVTISEAKPKS